jgi:hypothetical protein
MAGRESDLEIQVLRATPATDEDMGSGRRLLVDMAMGAGDSMRKGGKR